jgi:hypothetical protein
MASLPPSPFQFSEPSGSLDEAAASVVAPSGAAADILGSAPPISTEPTTAAVTATQPVTAAPLDDISNIGEIFVGARKLEQLPGRFDQAAITGADELRYVTLKLMDEPGTRDLPDVPQGLIDVMEPMPMFLRQAG